MASSRIISCLTRRVVAYGAVSPALISACPVPWARSTSTGARGLLSVQRRSMQMGAKRSDATLLLVRKNLFATFFSRPAKPSPISLQLAVRLLRVRDRRYAVHIMRLHASHSISRAVESCAIPTAGGAGDPRPERVEPPKAQENAMCVRLQSPNGTDATSVVALDSESAQARRWGDGL